MRGGNNGALYSDEEIAILRANRGMTAEQLSKLLPGRSKASICRYRWRHNLPRMEVGKKLPDMWTEDELRIMRENVHMTSEQLSKLLPNRTKRTIQRHRSRMGLRYPGAHSPAEIAWTQAELQFVRDHPHLSSRKLSALMPGRTAGAIQTIRVRHDIPRPPPQNPIVSPWTEAEIEVLRAHPHLYATQFGGLLPGRTRQAIGAYRKTHGLPTPGMFKRVAKPKAPKPVRVRAPKPAPAPKPPKLRIVPRRVEPVPKPQPAVIERDLRIGERRCTAVIPQPGGLFRKCTNPTSKGPVCPACLSFFRRAG